MSASMAVKETSAVKYSPSDWPCQFCDCTFRGDVVVSRLIRAERLAAAEQVSRSECKRESTGIRASDDCRRLMFAAKVARQNSDKLDCGLHRENRHPPGWYCASDSTPAQPRDRRDGGAGVRHFDNGLPMRRRLEERYWSSVNSPAFNGGVPLSSTSFTGSRTSQNLFG
jgi:hypothetical protein